MQRRTLTLHVDSTGSTIWFLDSGGHTTHRERRLLLSNFNLRIPADTAAAVQAGLDFNDRLPERFVGREMGEDALRVLDGYDRKPT